MDGLVRQPTLDTPVTQDGIVALDIPVILGQVGQEPIEVTVAGLVQAVELDIALVWDITPVWDTTLDGMPTEDGPETVDGGKFIRREVLYRARKEGFYVSFYFLTNSSIFDALRNSDRKESIQYLKKTNLNFQKWSTMNNIFPQLY